MSNPKTLVLTVGVELFPSDDANMVAELVTRVIRPVSGWLVQVW